MNSGDPAGGGANDRVSRSVVIIKRDFESQPNRASFAQGRKLKRGEERERVEGAGAGDGDRFAGERASSVVYRNVNLIIARPEDGGS